MVTAVRTSNLTSDKDLKAAGREARNVHWNVKQIFG
jgi:hypothetical protein